MRRVPLQAATSDFEAGHISAAMESFPLRTSAKTTACSASSGTRRVLWAAQRVGAIPPANARRDRPGDSRQDPRHRRGGNQAAASRRHLCWEAKTICLRIRWNSFHGRSRRCGCALSPYFMVGKQLTLIDFAYPEANRDMEDQFAMAMASAYGFHYDHSQLTLEGAISSAMAAPSPHFDNQSHTEKNAFRGYGANADRPVALPAFSFRAARIRAVVGWRADSHADMFLRCTPSISASWGSTRKTTG